MAAGDAREGCSVVPASRVAAAADAANDTNAAEQGRYGGAALDPGVVILLTFQLYIFDDEVSIFSIAC